MRKQLKANLCLFLCLVLFVPFAVELLCYPTSPFYSLVKQPPDWDVTVINYGYAYFVAYIVVLVVLMATFLILYLYYAD